MSEKSDFPKISVIIPSYNKVKYIGETLKSIVSQKYPNYEVIIQDGGSTDGSVEIIRKYANKYPTIKWESRKDNGQVDAINKGLQRSTGEIVTFINADDIYLNGALNIVKNSYLRNQNKLWFVGKGIVVDEKGRENKSLFYRYLVKPYKNILLKLNTHTFLLCVNYIMQPSVFLSRKAIDKFGPFVGTDRFVTEYKMWLDLANYEMPIIIDDFISAFRMTIDNITSAQTHDLLKEDFILIKKYTKNPLILGFHLMNNIGRMAFLRFTK